MSSRYFIKELWKYKDIRSVLCDEIIKELIEVGAFLGDSFRMVGIFYTAGGDEIYCCPKYVMDDCIKRANNNEEKIVLELQKHMRLIVKVLDKLRAENKNIEEISYDFSVHSMNSDRKRISRYGIAKGIVNDYLENGIYFKSEKEIRQCGRGKVRWGITMRKINPIISNNEVIYTKLLKQSDYKNYEDIITEIHKNVVLQCIDYLQKLGEKTMIKKPAVKTKIKPEEMYKYSNYIKQSMLIAYSNRELLLFKAMISWCDESPYYKGMGCTSCFLNVWEWVNDGVWGTIHKSSFKSSVPKYIFGERTYDGSGNQEPDTLAYVNNGEKKYLALFDSKYYVPKDNISDKCKTIIGLPSSKDVVKQIAYYNDIKSACGNDINYSNVFLLPRCWQFKDYIANKDDLWEMIGRAKKGTFSDLREELGIGNKNSECTEDIIAVVIINTEKLYNQYLIIGKIESQEIIKVSNQFSELE